MSKNIGQMQNQSGVTLVEVVVVSIIGVIVALMLITFVRVHNDELNEGIAKSRIQMQSELVSSEIGRKARSASLVLAGDESWSVSPVFSARDTVHRIVLYNNVGAVIRGYSTESDTLKESQDGITFTPYRTGGEIVRLAPQSNFRLLTGRIGVVLNLNFATLHLNKTYRSPAKRDMYLCRNRK